MNPLVREKLVLLGTKENLGEGDCFEPLNILTKSLNEEANLTVFGSLAVTYLLNSQLKTRSRVNEYLKKNEPQTISPPLFIMGLPRSGTTFLFHLLGNDPNHRSPCFWEILHLSPFSYKDSMREKNVIRRTNLELSLVNRLVPELRLVHPILSDFPEECTLLTALGLQSYSYIYVANTPSYQEYLMNADFTSGFLWHSRFLKVLESKEKPVRWLLKDPNHIEHLPEILKIYPEANFVHIHRDPIESIGSICSITSKVRSGFSNKVNNLQIGNSTLNYWDNALNKHLNDRNNISQEKIFNLQYSDLITDPLKQVKSIYSHFDYDLSEEGKSAMESFLSKPSQLKEGKHRYELENFGLSSQLVKKKLYRYFKELVLG